MSTREAGIDPERLFEERLRSRLSLWCEHVRKAVALKKELVSADVLGLTSPGRRLAVLDDPLGHRCRDALGDLLLDREYVLQGSVVPLHPEVCSSRGLHELRRDAHATAGATDAALDHVPGPEHAADLAHIRAFAAEGKRGVRAITIRSRKRESSVMMSSVMPSLK